MEGAGKYRLGFLEEGAIVVSFQTLQEGTRLRGPFWPEEIEVVKSCPLGTSLLITSKGLKSRTFYEDALSPAELKQLEVITHSGTAFDGDPEDFFLAAEVHRIRYVHQFD